MLIRRGNSFRFPKDLGSESVLSQHDRQHPLQGPMEIGPKKLKEKQIQQLLADKGGEKENYENCKYFFSIDLQEKGLSIETFCRESEQSSLEAKLRAMGLELNTPKIIEPFLSAREKVDGAFVDLFESKEQSANIYITQEEYNALRIIAQLHVLSPFLYVFVEEKPH